MGVKMSGKIWWRLLWMIPIITMCNYLADYFPTTLLLDKSNIHDPPISGFQNYFQTKSNLHMTDQTQFTYINSLWDNLYIFFLKMWSSRYYLLAFVSVLFFWCMIRAYCKYSLHQKCLTQKECLPLLVHG